MKKIIHYDRKYIFTKMLHTCRKKYLEYRGPYQLMVLEKGMPAADHDDEPVPILYVETEDHQYQGMLEVNLIEYGKMKKGQYYGEGGVVFYTKKEECYYMTKHDNPKTAIRRMVRAARMQFIGVIFAAWLLINFIILLIRPLLR